MEQNQGAASISQPSLSRPGLGFGVLCSVFRIPCFVLSAAHPTLEVELVRAAPPCAVFACLFVFAETPQPDRVVHSAAGQGRSSGENAIAETPLRWPRNVARSVPVAVKPGSRPKRLDRLRAAG